MRICLDCGALPDDHDVERCGVCAGPTVALHDTGEDMAGRVLGDRYALLRRLGEGGYGQVYSARHLALEQLVAVKVMHREVPAKPERLQRFYREAKNTSRLKHPNNVRVTDFGHTDDELAYIVMELVDGEPLRSLPRPLQARRAIRIAEQISSALVEAHGIGLVHRDLKPDNVMISRVDGSDFVRVLDYGIAKFEDCTTSLTETGAFIGTPDYTSPEQIDGAKIDRRCDVYLLGLILYELLTGAPPFDGDTAMALLYKHMHQEPQPLGALVEVSVELELLVMGCLAKSPDDRPRTMKVVRDRLAALPEVQDSEVRVGLHPFRVIATAIGMTLALAAAGLAWLLDTAPGDDLQDQATAASATAIGATPSSGAPTKRSAAPTPDVRTVGAIAVVGSRVDDALTSGLRAAVERAEHLETRRRRYRERAGERDGPGAERPDRHPVETSLEERMRRDLIRSDDTPLQDRMRRDL